MEFDNSKEWLEYVLQSGTTKRAIRKVVSVSAEPAVGKGENYTSILTRLNLQVVLGNGVATNYSVIQKCIPDGPIRRTLALGTGMFHTEIKMFRSVFPQMEKLMHEFGDWREPLWGDCYLADAESGIFLQDLRFAGYKVADRKKGLDIKHSKIVLSGLARFHAMSVILTDNMILNADDYTEYFFAKYKDSLVCNFAIGGFETLAEVIRTTWPKEWSDTSARIKAISENVVKRLYDVTQQEDTKFKVINHGDPWVNNIMFRYDIDTGDVCGVRFVDWQISNWNSPALDIYYFLRTSIKPELMFEYYDDLLKCYHDSLMKTFEKYKHEPRVTFTLEDLHSEMESKVFAGFFALCLIKPMVVADGDEATDLEVVMSSPDRRTDGRTKTYTSDICTEDLMKILPHDMKRM